MSELHRADGKVQYNAAYVLNQKTLKNMEHGKVYTVEELFALNNGEPLQFLRTTKDSEKDFKSKWRYV